MIIDTIGPTKFKLWHSIPVFIFYRIFFKYLNFFFFFFCLLSMVLMLYIIRYLLQNTFFACMEFSRNREIVFRATRIIHILFVINLILHLHIIFTHLQFSSKSAKNKMRTKKNVLQYSNICLDVFPHSES